MITQVQEIGRLLLIELILRHRLIKKINLEFCTSFLESKESAADEFFARSKRTLPPRDSVCIARIVASSLVRFNLDEATGFPEARKEV